MKEPAHKILIDRFISWDLVKERLERYKNVGKFYTLNDLQNCSNKAPYYCHYLGWRLGTWENEQWFEFFDKLLDNAITLSNWHKARIPQGCEFENFWSFVWELQVAQFFSNSSKASVEWTNSGPDLKINSNWGQFFVECTIYRKSFGLEEFIGELLTHLHPGIRVHHIPFTIFSLPKDKNIEFFLDELCVPFLDDSFLDTKVREVQQVSPITYLRQKG